MVRRKKVIPDGMFDYRDILRAEFKKRKALSPKYSLRDFARDLQLWPSHLSGLLRNKKGLSKESAMRILPTFRFSPQATQRLIFSVVARSGRARWKRNMAWRALKRPHSVKYQSELTSNCTDALSWHRQTQLFHSQRLQPTDWWSHLRPYLQIVERIMRLGLHCFPKDSTESRLWIRGPRNTPDATIRV